MRESIPEMDPRLRGGVGRYGVRAKKEASVKSDTPRGDLID